MEYLAAFFGMVGLDFTWALYTRAASQGRKWRAASIATILYALSAFVMVNIVHNWWVLIPACAGAFIGTLLGVGYDKETEQRKVCGCVPQDGQALEQAKL